MSVVTLDAVAYGETGANASWQVSLTITSHTNPGLALDVFLDDTGAVSVQSVSGAGVTWSHVASGAGNGRFRGETWKGVGTPSTGAQLITITLTGAVSNDAGAYAWSVFNVDPTTPFSGSVFTTAGNAVLNLNAGDMALASQFDNNNNRTVTGCTSSTDDTGFSNVGHSAAHCTSTPTSTFTWSGFDVNSVAVALVARTIAIVNPTGPFVTARPDLV